MDDSITTASFHWWSPLPENELPERLAAVAHEAWSGWMKYMLSKCEPVGGMGKAVLIPEWAVERWTRQMNTPYSELPEDERESDRKEAERYLAVIFSFYGNT